MSRTDPLATQIRLDGILGDRIAHELGARPEGILLEKYYSWVTVKMRIDGRTYTARYSGLDGPAWEAVHHLTLDIAGQVGRDREVRARSISLRASFDETGEP